MTTTDFSQLMYGRVEIPLSGSNPPKPGYQLVGCSPDINEKLAQQIVDQLAFSPSAVANYWNRLNEPNVPDLWSFKRVFSSRLLIAKTVFLQDSEFLDRNNRSAPVTHVLLVAENTFKEIQYNPFQIIDSQHPIMINSIESIIKLKENNFEFDEELFNALIETSLGDPQPGDNPDDIIDHSSLSEEGLTRLFNEQVKIRTIDRSKSIRLKGTSADQLAFLRNVFSRLLDKSRVHLSFTTNPDYEGYWLAAGSQNGSEIFIDLTDSKTKVSIPNVSNDSDKVFFWNKWADTFPNLTLAESLAHSFTLIALGNHVIGHQLHPGISSRIDENVLALYWQVNLREIAWFVFDELKEHFSEEFASPFVDFWISAQNDLEGRLNGICVERFWNRDRLCREFYAWFVALKDHAIDFLNKKDLQTLILLAQETGHCKLHFLAAAMVGSKSERQQVLNQISDEEFREMLEELHFLPAVMFVHEEHLESFMQSLPLGYRSDKDLFDSIKLIFKRHQVNLPDQVIARIQRMQPRMQSQLERLGIPIE